MVKKSLSSLRQYLNSSQTFHYSLILTLPLLGIYEFGVLILFADSFFELRNSGEVLLRSLFTALGLTNPYIVSGILIGIFLIVMIKGYQTEKKPGIHSDYFVFMLIESVLWGGVLFILLQLFTQIPLQIATFEDKLANMNLAIGAGLFEELIFRLILITAILTILVRGLSFSSSYAVPLSILFASIIFAAFHLFMEAYSPAVFSQRMVGGIFLGLLFRIRGYGISVYTHVIYNFLILAGEW